MKEEVEQHLADRYDELRRAGVTAEEAQREIAAEREELAEQSRRARIWSGAGGDLRYALRTLRKSAGVSLVVIFTLALGIGANAAIFTVVNAVVLRPLPYAQADRLVAVWGNLPLAHLQDIVVSAVEYVDFQTRNRVFDAMAAYASTAFDLTDHGEPERVNGAVVTATLFPLLGVTPASGRLLQDADNQPGHPRVALLSHALWRRRFGGDPTIVGQTMAIDSEPTEIVGVMPARFRFPDPSIDVWMPIVFNANLLGENNRGSRNYSILGRLKPGVSIALAQRGMTAVADAMRRDYPAHYRSGFTTTVRGLQDEVVGDSRRGLYVLLAAVVAVLLMACANIANLLLVRAQARKREMAIRVALGASRSRLARQMLIESLALAIAGGAAGLLVGMWGVELLVALAPPDIPRLHEVTLDGRIVAFTASISVLAGILFAATPALRASRTDPHDALKEGGRTIAVRGRDGRRALVVAEVALSLVLLVATGLLIGSFARLHDVPPGFDPNQLLTFRVAPPPATYSFEKSEQLFDAIFARLKSIPGVESVGAINALPFSGFGGDRSFFLEGQLNPGPEQRPDEQVRFVSAGYFAAMRIPLRRGREFSDRDTLQAPRVAVVNEAAARRYWPNVDPIGQRFTFDRETPRWYQIVGIAGNIRHRSLDAAEKPEVYVAYAQPLFDNPTARPMFVVARTAFDPSAAAASVREIVRSIDPNQPISSVLTMQERIAESLGPRRFTMLLLVAFGGVALVLAALGIYGVVACAVSERMHEIGVRLALGAQPREIMRMVVGHGLSLAVVGIAVGLVGAWLVTESMRTLLYGVSPHDPVTYTAIALLLTAIAVSASYLPGRRAVRVDPTLTLRSE
jgi:putative ABC transport system permease protein